MNKTLTSNKDLTVAIVGTGNVATHLMKALGGKCRLIRILPRTPEDIPSSTDIALIAVKDDAINEVADKIAGKAGIVLTPQARFLCLHWQVRRAYRGVLPASDFLKRRGTKLFRDSRIYRGRLHPHC